MTFMAERLFIEASSNFRDMCNHFLSLLTFFFVDYLSFGVLATRDNTGNGARMIRNGYKIKKIMTDLATVSCAARVWTNAFAWEMSVGFT